VGQNSVKTKAAVATMGNELSTYPEDEQLQNISLYGSAGIEAAQTLEKYIDGLKTVTTTTISPSASDVDSLLNALNTLCVTTVAAQKVSELVTAADLILEKAEEAGGLTRDQSSYLLSIIRTLSSNPKEVDSILTKVAEKSMYAMLPEEDAIVTSGNLDTQILYRRSTPS
jgi:hypothetical protein